MPTVTLVINELPYRNDRAWNALRLATELLTQGTPVNIFLLGDGVDVGRVNHDPGGKDYHVEEMTQALLAQGVPIMACSTCLNVCGVSRERLAEGIVAGHMSDLARWVSDSGKVLTF